ncbi:unnamed protein product, partial [Didymodactylos carnosus]
RRLKQQKLWFTAGMEQKNHVDQSELNSNTVDYTTKSTEQYPNGHQFRLPDLPQVNDLEVTNFPTYSIVQSFQVMRDNKEMLPLDFYERLIIKLHSQLIERLDYKDLIIARTGYNDYIKVERLQLNKQSSSHDYTKHYQIHSIWKRITITLKSVDENCAIHIKQIIDQILTDICMFYSGIKFQKHHMMKNIE